jgi:uncharacterized membrane protein YuzA (DUF378 family)
MDEASRLYKDKMLSMVAISLVLIGGLNWLTAVFFKKDAVALVLGTKILGKTVYFLVGVAALYLVFKRDSYLPFLGETILPCAAFGPRTPDNANQEVTITTLPNTKVVYWASEPKKDASGAELESWNVAYNDYTNSGVAVSDDKGKAVLHFRGSPRAYTVPYKGTIKPHVHFRICKSLGMLGPVQTYFLDTGAIEKFTLQF